MTSLFCLRLNNSSYLVIQRSSRISPVKLISPTAISNINNNPTNNTPILLVLQIQKKTTTVKLVNSQTEEVQRSLKLLT